MSKIQVETDFPERVIYASRNDKRDPLNETVVACVSIETRDRGAHIHKNTLSRTPNVCHGVFELNEIVYKMCLIG